MPGATVENPYRVKLVKTFAITSYIIEFLIVTLAYNNFCLKGNFIVACGNAVGNDEKKTTLQGLLKT